jgi:hypothetical protein
MGFEPTTPTLARSDPTIDLIVLRLQRFDNILKFLCFGLQPLAHDC